MREDYMVNGRRVRVYRGIPGHYIMLLHPLGGSIEYMERHLPIHLVPNGESPTVIICDGTAPARVSSFRSWHAGRGVVGAASWMMVDDFKHLRDVERRVCTDRSYNLTYCGFSNGAYMSQTMAARTGRHCITFAGHLTKDWEPVGNARCDNFVGSDEQFAPEEGKIRIGSWLIRQEDYKTQAAKWPGGHNTVRFVGGHVIPEEVDGLPIEMHVVTLYSLGLRP